MTPYEIVGYLLIGIFTSPIVVFLLGFYVFLLVKMGRYGYLMANKKHNGQKSKDLQGATFSGS